MVARNSGTAFALLAMVVLLCNSALRRALKSGRGRSRRSRITSITGASFLSNGRAASARERGAAGGPRSAVTIRSSCSLGVCLAIGFTLHDAFRAARLVHGRLQIL